MTCHAPSNIAGHFERRTRIVEAGVECCALRTVAVIFNLLFRYRIETQQQREFLEPTVRLLSRIRPADRIPECGFCHLAVDLSHVNFRRCALHPGANRQSLGKRVFGTTTVELDLFMSGTKRTALSFQRNWIASCIRFLLKTPRHIAIAAAPAPLRSRLRAWQSPQEKQGLPRNRHIRASSPLGSAKS